MTENRYILNKNAEVEDTSTCMTFDSFIEVLTVLNGQDARIKHLERERCATKKQYDKWLSEAEKRIKELEQENERMKIAFKRKYDYDIAEVVDEVYDGDVDG